jgi:hypothetical protein
VVEESLRRCLAGEGYALSAVPKHGETGVDVEATMGRRRVYIEVIGYKSCPPARAKDFFEVFFRAISRIEGGARRIVIALPARFEKGLPTRAGHYGVAWWRLGQAFPELRMWLVDTEEGSYEERRDGTNGCPVEGGLHRRRAAACSKHIPSNPSGAGPLEKSCGPCYFVPTKRPRRLKTFHRIALIAGANRIPSFA